MTIGESEKLSKRARPFLGLSIVHKFFFLGGIAGFLGTSWLGVHLWMMLNGKIPIPANYHNLRTIHAVVQLYGFLGLFIAGFLLQAAPKIFRLKPSPSKVASIALVPTFMALGLMTVAPHSPWISVLLAITWSIVTWTIIRLIVKADQIDLIRAGIPTTIGSCSFLLGVLLDWSHPLDALLLFWCGVFPIIFASSQQFLFAFLGGKRLEGKAAYFFLASLLMSIAAICLYRFLRASDLLWNIYALFAFLTFFIFFGATNLIFVCWKRILHPIGFAFTAMMAWGIAGALTLFRGPGYADYSLHIWATGVAVTLIMATSSRIIGLLTGGRALNDASFVFVLAIWQIVPFGRGGFFVLPSVISWFVGFAALISTSTWLGLIVYRTVSLAYRSTASRTN